MAGIQGQLNLLNRLIISKQQQEQEQIPESPSPSPVLSTSGNSRSNLSRSRHSSTTLSHASTTTALEEERAHEIQHFDENGVAANYNSLDKDENDSPQSTCRIS